MSYCRASIDSDVYCYGTHSSDTVNNKKYSTIYCTHISLNVKSPFDGASFQDYTLREFLNRLLSLQEAGIKIPQSAIDRIQKELKL